MIISPFLIALAVGALLRLWTRPRRSAVPMRGRTLRRLQRRRLLPRVLEISRAACGGAGELHPADRHEVLCDRAL